MPPEVPEPSATTTTETAALPGLDLPGLDLPDLALPDLDVTLPDDIALPEAATSETETAEAPPTEEVAPVAPETPTAPVHYVADLTTHPLQLDAYTMIENTTYGGITRTNGKIHVLYTANAVPADDGTKKACPT